MQSCPNEQFCSLNPNPDELFARTELVVDVSIVFTTHEAFVCHFDIDSLFIYRESNYDIVLTVYRLLYVILTNTVQ